MTNKTIDAIMDLVIDVTDPEIVNFETCLQSVRAAITAALAHARADALAEAETALSERAAKHGQAGNEIRMSEAYSCGMTVRALKGAV